MGTALGGVTALGSVGWTAASEATGETSRQSARDLFPRLDEETFINGAGGTPLGRFAEESIERYLDVIRLGPGEGRGAWWGEVWDGVRGRFGALIGAEADEVGLVESTKAGEQLLLDALPGLRSGGNVVTNDLHFSGSLHNLEGLRRSGVDVRFVPSRQYRIDVDRMADSIDDRTELVTVSLVSNVTGHIEAIRSLTDLAHAHGALLFADIIQAAGIVPIDVKAMGIDVAACSSYKWLYGIHGAGFLYVSRELQGGAIPDERFPGTAQRRYPPFAADGTDGTLTFSPRASADRYRPGHVNYLGYAAAHAGLDFVASHGVGTLLEHTVSLNRRIVDQLDRDRYRVLSSHLDESPILALGVPDVDRLRDRLRAANVVISVGGDAHDLARISPAIYNTEADVDRLAEVLHEAAP